jgi:hypothetical protein
MLLTDYPRPDYRYRARIEAPGYRSVLSEQSFAPWDGRVVINFELERAAARSGQVVDEAGQPLADASIVVGTPSDVPMMRGGALEWGTEVTTASDGTFELSATFEPVRVRAVHPSGIGEVLRQPDEELGTITLRPWATLSGQLVQDGQPIAEQWIYFSAIPTRGLGEARFQDSYAAKTDKDGRFAFPRLPPGTGAVRSHLGPWQPSPLTSGQTIPLNLEPGEQKELALGGSGVVMTGKVNDTGRGDVVLNKNSSLNYLIRRDAPSNLPPDFPTLSFDPSGPVESSWFLSPDIYTWLATRPNYFVKLSPDGDFRIHGVPPGQYDLVLRLYEQPSGCLVETVGKRTRSSMARGSSGRFRTCTGSMSCCTSGPAGARRAFSTCPKSSRPSRNGKTLRSRSSGSISTRTRWRRRASWGRTAGTGRRCTSARTPTWPGSSPSARCRPTTSSARTACWSPPSRNGQR